MRIGIIGTGNMGRAIGVSLSRLGHDVFFGARNVQKAEQAVALTGNQARSGSNAEAATYGEVVLFTARGVDPQSIVEDVSQLDGKVVVDCNNTEVPKTFLYPPRGRSLAEELQSQIANARVVKSFNTMAMEVFEHCPSGTREMRIANFVCGNDEDARNAVAVLSNDLGFDTIDCGTLDRARLLEGQADFIRMLMISGVRSDAAFSIARVPQVVDLSLGGREETRLGVLK